MAPNELCRVETWPPVKPSRKPRKAHIVSGKDRLPISARGFLTSSALAQLEREEPEERVQRMLDSLKNKGAEHDAVVREQQHFMLSHAFKTDVLQKNGRAKVRPLHELPTGEVPLLAVEMRLTEGARVQGKAATAVFHVPSANGGTDPFASRKEFDAAFQQFERLLEPLMNRKGAYGKLNCYMHAEASGHPVGTITRKEGSLLDTHGRPKLDVTVELVLPDGTRVRVVEGGRAVALPAAHGEAEEGEAEEGEAEEGEAEAEGEERAQPLPRIERPRPCPASQFRKLHTILSGGWDKSKGAVVEILAMWEAFGFANSTYVPLRVRIDEPHPSAGEHTAMSCYVRGVFKLREKIDSANCTLFVSAVTAKDETCELVDRADLWWQAAKHDKHAYAALPQLSKQLPSAPSHGYTVVGVKTVPNFRRDKEVPIIRTEEKTNDGNTIFKTFSFSCPQSAIVLDLPTESNSIRLKLDVHKWRTSPA